MKTLFIMPILCLSCVLVFSQCEQPVLSTSDISNETLSEQEISSLQYLREEEFLAGDVYDNFSEIFSIPIFKTIGRSEDIHTAKVKDLLNLYKIEDPALDHVAGQYKNTELQELYISLVAKGEKHLDSAIVVGLTIEEKDIFDLNEALHGTIESENIRLVYEFLLMGSHNHLKAFNFHSEKRGIEFTPQFLTQSEFSTALND